MVLIDIEMPERCCNCPCHECLGPLSECKILDKRLENPRLRPAWCPLKEVQE